MEDIQLREALIEDIPMLENYTLVVDSYFTKPMDALTESLHETEKHPILILKADKLVGFFILQRGESLARYTDNVQSILFKSHSIDLNYQGQGYAKASLKLLPNYIRTHFPEVEEIVLSVEADNISSQMLYVRSGFKSNHRQVDEDGEQKLVFVQPI